MYHTRPTLYLYDRILNEWKCRPTATIQLVFFGFNVGSLMNYKGVTLLDRGEGSVFMYYIYALLSDLYRGGRVDVIYIFPWPVFRSPFFFYVKMLIAMRCPVCLRPLVCPGVIFGVEFGSSVAWGYLLSISVMFSS